MFVSFFGIVWKKFNVELGSWNSELMCIFVVVRKYLCLLIGVFWIGFFSYNFFLEIDDVKRIRMFNWMFIKFVR